MRDSQATIEILHRLRDAGVWLAIDDFGTGYSSLNYLRRFPIHQIKIDQSFVREMLSDAGAAGIVRGIIALAKSLKLAIVAEGVETAEQLEHLRAEGCDTAQGFLFSRAVPHDEFAALLRTWGQ
jgi:EAL domain-containing protein (putative c-di-GMP-specific phosphodiesterase class I)